MQELEAFLSESARARISVIRAGLVSSTNTEIKNRARLGAVEGTLMIADSQSSGRGRLSKSFFSQADCGLYMSILLRPAIAADDAVYITTAAALAVNRAIKSVFGIKTGIKWVNDILLEGKKICGILTESETGPDGKLSYAVLGIGINLCDPPDGYPAEISERARSLGVSYEKREELAAAVWDEFFPIYDALPDRGFMDDYTAKRVDL